MLLLRRQCYALIPLLALTLGASGGKRAIAPADFYRIVSVSDPRLSPDGHWVAYVATRPEERQNRRRATIWMIAADGSGAHRQLTTAQSATHPRWSPDGRGVAFLSARPLPDEPPSATPRVQVYFLPLDGGEPRRLTSFKNGVTAFEWSPDGTRLACISRSGARDERARDASDVRHYLYPFYKLDGSGWFDDRRSHLYVVNLRARQTVQLTSEEQRNDVEPAWSPDGLRIAFTGLRTDSEKLDGEALAVPASGGQTIRISDPTLFARTPRWSPDGSRVAYSGEDRSEQIPRIWIAPASGGPSVQAAPDVSYPSAVEWSEDGRALYTDEPLQGAYQILHVDLASHKTAAIVTGDRAVRQLSLARGVPLMAYTASDPMHPSDLYVARLNGKGERQLTDVNAAFLDSVDLVELERLPYKGADGLPIDGFFLKPRDWRPGKTYPMVLSIHGGPNGMYGFSWSEEFQVFAAREWAVLFTNPRGSSGYGAKFQRAVAKEWGGKAYEDVMLGVDAALKKYPWVAADRMGVRGQSYGGFLTEWIVTETARFRAAVALSGISDFISDDGARDGFYGHAHDFGGTIFDNIELYRKYSPLARAQNVKTPVLVMHGENDQRVPLTQSEEWFRALKHFGVPSELVIFPHEGHSLRSQPRHAVESMEWELYWFDRYLNGNDAAAPPGGR